MKATVSVETTTQKTITSLELSEFTNRRHDSILRSIESMCEDLKSMGKPQPVVCKNKASNNKIQTYYTLTIYHCELLALALDGVARIKVLDKLEELRQNEAKAVETPPQTPYELQSKAINMLVQAGLGYEKKLKETTQVMNEGTKMLKFLDQRVENLTLENKKLKALTTGKAQTQQQVLKLTYSMDEMAEEIGIPLNRLYRILKFHGYLKKGNKPRKNYDGKYFVENRVYYDKGSRLRTFVLPQGFEYIKSLFQKGKLA